MKKIIPLLSLAMLVLSGCGDLFGGGRIGTDVGGNTSTENYPTGPVQVTWSRLVGDSSETRLVDTIDIQELYRTSLPLPESTCLAAVWLEGTGGTWIGARDSILLLRPPTGLVVRWKDERQRDGWSFELPCTGVRLGMPGSKTWMHRTVPVFAKAWPGRIVRREGARVGSWGLGPIRLSDTLDLDLAALPDSSCEVRRDSVGTLSCGGR